MDWMFLSSTNFIDEVPALNYDISTWACGCCLSWEGRAIMNELVPFKRTKRASLPLLPREVTGKNVHLRRDLSPNTDLTSDLTWTFLLSRTMSNIFVFLSQPSVIFCYSLSRWKICPTKDLFCLATNDQSSQSIEMALQSGRMDSMTT